MRSLSTNGLRKGRTSQDKRNNSQLASCLQRAGVEVYDHRTTVSTTPFIKCYKLGQGIKMEEDTEFDTDFKGQILVRYSILFMSYSIRTWI